MKERSRSLGDLIMGITVTVLFVVILTLVVFAARGYQFSVENQDNNGNMRAVVSYIANCVRDNNSDTVNIENRNSTECLVITSKEGYEQIFYLNDGELLEQYGIAGSSPNPESALHIGDTESFALEMKDNGLLEIITDEGVAYVNTNEQ